MGSMDDILRRSLLFDFYGELLTDHQKNIYEASVSEDLSLSEIAAQEGISRQGVHDLINRTDKILENYEQKLHLVERFHPCLPADSVKKTARRDNTSKELLN